MKIAIYSPNGSIAKTDHSHRAAWAKMRVMQEQQLEGSENIEFVFQPKPEEIPDFDAVYLYYGMETDRACIAGPHYGKLDKKMPINLFGGLTEKNLNALVAPLYAKELYQLDQDWNYTCALQPRLLKEGFDKSDPNIYDAISINLFNRLNEAQIVHQPYFKNLVLGDSHALSLYRRNTMIDRQDFMTMHGLVHTYNIEALINNFKKRNNIPMHGEFNKYTFCFGQIDVRHHLMRQDYPQNAAASLAIIYVDKIKEFAERLFLDEDQIEICTVLPLEDESRRIPGTGNYKGTPFYGSWEERNVCRIIMNATIKQSCEEYGFICYDRDPIFMDPATGKLPFEHMEKPSSVHTSWTMRREVVESQRQEVSVQA